MALYTSVNDKAFQAGGCQRSMSTLMSKRDKNAYNEVL